jgi:hypothetical protein
MQNNLRKRKSGVEKPEVESRKCRRDRCSSYPKEMADFVGCTHGHFLLWPEDAGKREFSGKARAATNVAATHLAATHFIIILPRLLSLRLAAIASASKGVFQGM